MSKWITQPSITVTIETLSAFEQCSFVPRRDRTTQNINAHTQNFTNTQGLNTQSKKQRHATAGKSINKDRKL